VLIVRCCASVSCCEMIVVLCCIVLYCISAVKTAWLRRSCLCCGLVCQYVVCCVCSCVASCLVVVCLLCACCCVRCLTCDVLEHGENNRSRLNLALSSLCTSRHRLLFRAGLWWIIILLVSFEALYFHKNTTRRNSYDEENYNDEEKLRTLFRCVAAVIQRGGGWHALCLY